MSSGDGEDSQSGELYRGPGLYIHIPFCSRICPYCDFAVLIGRSHRQKSFLEHLTREIELYDGKRSRFDTLYFGGGTPSLLAPEDLQRIVDTVRAKLDLAEETWLFLEVNPEHVTAAAINGWRELGVKTLCLGVQSFGAETLAFLGRQHVPVESRRSIEAARQAGFHTVSVDLIYGLPGQDLTAWRRDLTEALSLCPDHLSCYQLTVQDKTAFALRKARGKLRELSDEKKAEMFLWTHRFLEDSGYSGYEVSSFALSAEHESRHNRKYWNHTSYLGLGPSAHSYSSRRRWWNERRLMHWEERIRAGERPVEGSEHLAPRELALEALMLGLRTRAGVDLNSVQEKFGIDLAESNRALIERSAEKGYINVSGTRLEPTLVGLAIADTLAASFSFPE